MPDTGDFDREQNNQAADADWTDAFSALPLETPTADGWQRLQARLPAAPTRERTRWPLWLATAASLALVIAIPLRMQSTTSHEPSATIPSPDQATTQPVTDTGVEVASVQGVRVPIENIHTPTQTQATTARVDEPQLTRHSDASQRPIHTAAQPADSTRIASIDTTDVPAIGASLESLYAASAQLEGLLALSRDERVSSGTAAALTGALVAQVASIDAALAQTDVSPQGRNGLWQERVDTLRQLAGIETTQRLYAARGQQFESALVSID